MTNLGGAILIAVLAPVVMRPLHPISGRVVDRQGKPVAGVDVFEAGDGPVRTSARTGQDGRFVLGGFFTGRVFVFARAQGFRFEGQLVKPGDADVTVELTRTTERPARELTTLPDPIPIEESRALARRLLDRWWSAAVEKKDEGAKYFVTRFLVAADPVEALRKIDAVKFPNERSRSALISLVARTLAKTDLDEAETVAESIGHPGIRAGTLAYLVDLVAPSDRRRKLDLLSRATVQAHATTEPADRIFQLGEIAVRLLELGEIEKARELFADGRRRAMEFPDRSFKRRSFAALLARVDSPGALALAKALSGEKVYGDLIAESVAFGLAWGDPAEAERFLSQYPLDKRHAWLRPLITWKVAAADPRRARQLVDSVQNKIDRPAHEFCLALGARGRDESIGRRAVDAGVQGLDRILEEEPTGLRQIGGRLLPIAEAIDPALVSDVLWRTLAARSAPGTPTAGAMPTPASLVAQTAWYDRELAAALFEPIRRQIEAAGDAGGAAEWDTAFEAWSLFDPRAAVAHLEKMPIKSVNTNDNRVLVYVVELLSRDHDERWRRTLGWTEWRPIFDPLNRDAITRERL
jgi:hypothetical protein